MLFLIFSFLFCFFIRPNLTATANDGLILTPFIKNGSIDLARHLSEVDSTRFMNIKSYSAFITVKEEYDSNLFFWYFPHEKADVTPLIIWLQGGPGFSSLFGLFNIIGPVYVAETNGTLEVKLREKTWATNYSLLFIDNPVGAGFSYTGNDAGYPDNEDDVGEQLFELLMQLALLFPELKTVPLFLAGQSYAGKYVPALGIQIHRRKQQTAFNLKGLSIGNGIIDPRNQMHYSELCNAMGFLEGQDIIKLEKLQDSVIEYIDLGDLTTASLKFNETIEFIKKKSGVSIYNFLNDPDSSAPLLEKFLERADVREWIHVGTTPFDFNNQVVYAKMLPDIMNTTRPFIEELLEHYGVMSYSGQMDIILSYCGSKKMYQELVWSRRTEYERAPRQILHRRKSGKSVIGYKKSGGNFVEVLVSRSGHSVPTDQPEVAKFLIDSFINQFK